MSLQTSFPMVLTTLAILAGAANGAAQVPIVQPGAPGEPSRQITAEEASDLASIAFTEADVRFMQGMISHHAQALEMTALLETRTQRDEMRQLAQRIELSQEDEIEMMQDWLRDRGQEVTAIDAHHEPGAMRMPGMLTNEQMTQLEQVTAVEFDRLFLEFMIEHHQGALTMVENLLRQRGSAQDSVLFGFTSDITGDQGIEIERMDAMLVGLSDDPRALLQAGFLDAGRAALNMELIAELQKPDGFFDPDNPGGLPAGSTAANGDDDLQDEQEEEERASRRPSLLDFANTDLAFAGDILFEGNYHGFNVYRVEAPGNPELLSSVVCPGGQGDVSVVGNLLIMSVEQTRGRLDCGLQGVADPVSPDRFRGIRVFDISDVRMPRQVAAVQTCRGSHTHTVIEDPDDVSNLYVYVSGTSSVRSGDELEGCSDERPGENPNTALFSIDVVRIPVARPEEARIVARPRVFADPDTGSIAGLWRGGDHGEGTQTTRETAQCHDITAFPEIGLAAGACSGNGILLDISDPTNPVRIDQVIDPGFAYWHSATFNNDGTKVIFTDEWGGGGRPRCRSFDPRNWGADAIFDIVDGRLEFRSYFKLPAPQTEEENCVAHNGSLVPVPGRDIFVQAWYQGGVSVIDFTDSSSPVEIAFFDRGPMDANELVMGGYWSTYWYKGHIYGTEIARGLDVLRLLPSEYLSENEIAAASLVAPATVNPQHQQRYDWPSQPVVALAYLDQLRRSNGLDAGQIDTVTGALDLARQALTGDTQADTVTADQLETLAAQVTGRSDAAPERDQSRLQALASTLTELAQRLR